MMARIAFLTIGLMAVTLVSIAEEFRPVWSPHQVNDAETFALDQKIVGTHYFYWYDYPKQHFFDHAGQTDDALQDHFVNPEDVSFRSVEWHKNELADCVEAGIDFILPVYWGVPDNYFQPGIHFSVAGLPPLQRAVEERGREGKPSPKIGLFYDTSTLLPGVRGVAGRSEKYDLTEDTGKDIFYRTIRDFFYQVHPKHWACIDGRPLVVLYGAGFAKRHGQSTVDYVYERFAKDFHGIKPYIIKDHSWNFACDATTRWGAALNGVYIFDTVAQIGPGYNDSAVPGRSTPIREREDGDFYRQGWNEILDSDANVVLIETWNEMHEGTDICESVEFGREYIDLTAKYAEAFKAGKRLREEIALEYPKPRPRPASDKGSEYKNAESVGITFDEEIQSQGIWLVGGQPDGPVRKAEIGGNQCIQSMDADNTYIYFNIADPYAFDIEQDIVIGVEYWDDGFESFSLQYDSWDGKATLDGAYKSTGEISCGNTKKWILKQFHLEDARLTNRQNGGSDFRFRVNGTLSIHRVEASR